MQTSVARSLSYGSSVLVAQVQLSVIIPCFNAASLIGAQLAALADQAYDGVWEVIVADNGSTDDTLAVARRFQGRLPRLRIVDASERKGAAHARNVGARAASGDHLIFVDADDIVAPDFLRAMGAALGQHDFVAPRLEACALNTHWAASLGQHPQYHGLKRYYNPPYLLYAGGCGLGIRRERFLELGGFDTQTQSLEDSEFCFRAQLAGLPLSFVPEATIHVRNRPSLRGMMRQSRAWGAGELGLVRRFRPAVSRPAAAALWARYFARWLKLALRLAQIRSRTDAARWAQEVARQVGIFEAALGQHSAPI